MNNLPVEIFEEVLLKINDLPTLSNFCKSNKAARELCKIHRVALCQRLIRIYEVDYKDPTNFIYVMNGVTRRTVIKKGKVDYCRALHLYANFFYEKVIVCSNKNISSIPLYPNVQKLVCDGNKLKTLPEGMTKLVYLDCSENKIKSLPKEMNELIHLDCAYNELRSLADNYFPKLEYFDCSINNLITLPIGMQELIHLNCSDNMLTSLPDHIHNLEFLNCSHNRLKELPNDISNLTFLNCSQNRFKELPLRLFKLRTLYCSGNLFSSSYLKNDKADFNNIEGYKLYVITTKFPPPGLED